MKTKNSILLLVLLLLGSGLVAQVKLVVAQDGSGDFTSIQAALNSLPEQAAQMREILIKKGTYREKLFVEKKLVTLKGEAAASTIIVTSDARDIYRCSNNRNDDWGVATINLKASDITLENLSFINEYGLTAKETVTIACPMDTVKPEKQVKPTAHQMALRSFGTTRLIVKNCIFRSGGGDTVSPWNTDEGMFYFSNCVMEGHVDMYCPRGWALADHCTFICHSKEAAIWHDGSKNQQSKSVFFNCRFEGDEGFKLGRYHRDAQLYLLDCSFSKNMADAAIYQKEANPPNVIQWGHRVYYYNCHRDGGDYEWLTNNLPQGTGYNDINVAWVYDYKWKPVKEKAGESEAEVLLNKKDTVAENMLLYQRRNGGWPKHFNKEKVDYRRMLSSAELSELRAGYDSSLDATIDNNATTKEIRYLVKAYKRSRDERFLAAAERGIEYLLNAQYKNGGWPQFYPDFSSYRSEITYNDNAMVNALNVLQDVLEGKSELNLIPASYHERCATAVERGIRCILKTQYKQKRKLTVWCAQYDAHTLKPAKARAYELPSLSGQESVGILRFLMRIKKPSKAIIRSIQAGAAWFDKVKIEGYQFKEIVSPESPNGKDRALVAAPGNVTWARFYRLDDNQPFFCGRDGQPKMKLEEIEWERRNGYAWYTEAPADFLNKDYAAWKERNSIH